jgi:exopolyphosphatase / guanosine-5'-triphosphate,3'-diphosphate pyrophosphatase
LIKLAAIDIGSNAVRLMLARVIEDRSEITFVKESLIRFPLRLGEDVFSSQRISKVKAEKLEVVIRAFKDLIDASDAVAYIACATSAMREARNGAQVAKQIALRTGVEIKIIDGKREAEIIYSSHVGHSLRFPSPLLYVDVGGGSTELTLLSQSKIIESNSFKIGAVRMLQKGRPKQEWDAMKKWLSDKVVPFHPKAAVGTGGSINSIFKLSRKRDGKPLSAKQIRAISEYVGSFTVDERIKLLDMRPDRADVILEASDIYLSVMKVAEIKKMYVPILGLSDGLIYELYTKLTPRQPGRRANGAE